MGLTPELDDKLILTFYGDDFTGSTDAMEAATMAGIPTMLFLKPPSIDDLRRHPGLRAVGVAGTSRGRSPEWMNAELPAIFHALKQLGAPYCHYKTCSTFDSAPHIGNIGRAAEIGQDVFGAPVLIAVGVARHKRYVVFSNLFAAAAYSSSGSPEIFRIDRHPTMSRHPVTPMAEADLRLHLGRQTDRRVVGFDFLDMLAADSEQRLAQLTRDDADIVILDSFDAATTLAAGRLMASHAAGRQVFLAGSSAVDYALTDYLTSTGQLPLKEPPGRRGPVDKLLAVCGSCSPITEAQIAWAEAHGFVSIAVDTPAVVTRGDTGAMQTTLVDTIRDALTDRPGVVLHTARGSTDPRIGPTRAALRGRGLRETDSAPVLGGFLGSTIQAAMRATGLRRIVLAGGDSSSHAVQAMGIEAMEVAGPLVPGAPLCRVHSPLAFVDGAEIVLKGGQTGDVDSFGKALAGR